MKSVKERYKGMTYAAAAEKVANKYKNRKSDSLQQQAYLQEMKMLMNMQEEVMAERSAQEFALGKMLTENPQAQEMMQGEQPQQPMMKEGGKFPDKYKKMGFSGVDKPKKTPGASKSHAVVVKDGDSYKLIRFGQQGVSGAGSNPKSDKEKARQKSFKARHAKNISKGKTSAAYWADKVKWKEGGWIQEAVDKKKLAPGGELPETIPPYGTVYGDSSMASFINQVRDATKYPNPLNSQFKNIMGATFNSNTKPIGSLDGMYKSMLERSMDTALEKPMDTALENTQQQQAQQKSDQERMGELGNQYQQSSVFQQSLNQGQKAQQRKSDSAYDAAIAGSRINKLINAGLILAGPERRAPVFNPMEGDVMNKVNAMGVNLDPVRQSIQSSANAAINRLSNLSRSAGNLKSNIANIYASMNTNLANVDMQQQQQLNQIRQSQASILNNLGVNRQQSIGAAKEINDRNRAAWQNEISKFGAAILDDGKFFTRMEVQKGQNLLMSRILSDSFADFNLNPDLMAKISEGRYGDITNQELITLEKTLPENKFQTFAQVYGQETGKEVTPTGQAATPNDKKKSEVVTQQPTSTQQGSTAPALPQASREQVQQAVTTALSARTGSAPAPAPATPASNATPAATQDPGKEMNPPRTSFNKTTSAKDMDQAIDQILNFEATQGSRTGTGLSNYGISSLQNPTKEEAKEYIKTNIAPLVASVPGSVEEKRSLMDHWFNSGTDGRIYAYQEYLRRTDPNNTTGWKDAEGKWKDRNKFRKATKRDDGKYGYTNPQLDQEMTELYNSIPPNQRRTILKSGRDWYYQNTDVGSGKYEASWKDRVEETGD